MAVRSCGTQLLWIMHQLLDYNIPCGLVPIMCSNTSTISISKYTVHHSKAKHINIKDDFLRDHVENEYFVRNFVNFEN